MSLISPGLSEEGKFPIHCTHHTILASGIERAYNLVQTCKIFQYFTYIFHPYYLWVKSCLYIRTIPPTKNVLDIASIITLTKCAYFVSIITLTKSEYFVSTCMYHRIIPWPWTYFVSVGLYMLYSL